MTNHAKKESEESNVVGIEEGLAKLAKAAGQDPPGEGMEMLTVSMDQPLSHAAREMGQVLSGEPIFRLSDSYVTIDQKTGDFEPMPASRFCSWVESYFFTTKNRRAGVEILTMSRDYASQILAADQFRLQIREIQAVNTVRLPVWRGPGEIQVNPSGPFWLVEGAEWRVELLPPGYDERTKTFTVGAVEYPEDMSVKDADIFLNSMVEGFPWIRDEEGLGNTRTLGVHYAAMLGVFCKSMFKPRTIRPLVVFNGNQPGSGKSLLMRMCTAPVFGAVAEKSKPSNEEITKLLDVVSMQAKPYLCLDDCPSLHNAALNQFITSPVHEARVLGQSRLVKNDQVTQVFATGNQLSLAEDLVRRSLVVDLFEPGTAVDRTFENELTPDWLVLKETRAKFLSALWAIVRDWSEKGMPYCKDTHHTSAPVWASVIGSVVYNFNDKLRPFAKRKFGLGGDESGSALEALVVSIASGLMGVGAELKPSEIVDIAEEKDLLEAITGHCKDARKALGHRLKKLRGRHFLDSNGRKFEFGKSDKSFGAVYPIRFLSK